MGRRQGSSGNWVSWCAVILKCNFNDFKSFTNKLFVCLETHSVLNGEAPRLAPCVVGCFQDQLTCARWSVTSDWPLLLLLLQAQHGWQECADQAGSPHHHPGSGETTWLNPHGVNQLRKRRLSYRSLWCCNCNRCLRHRVVFGAIASLVCLHTDHSLLQVLVLPPSFSLLLPLLCCTQLGSWVPAASCRLSVFDGVFSRMGASDCLLAGRSTFAEELGDASHILGTATNR
jgi:hypothetical protein